MAYKYNHNIGNMKKIHYITTGIKDNCEEMISAQGSRSFKCKKVKI
jgi:hypothetical protein